MTHEEVFTLFCKTQFEDLKQSQKDLQASLEFIKENMAHKDRVEALEASHQRLRGAGQVLSILFTLGLALVGLFAKIRFFSK